jgi:hypothetical protein
MNTQNALPKVTTGTVSDQAQVAKTLPALPRIPSRKFFRQ